MGQQLQRRELLANVLLHPRLVQYPPDSKYMQRVLRKLVDLLERAQIEVVDDLYDRLRCSTVTADESTQWVCRTFPLEDGGDAPWITLVQSSALIVNGTTGLSVWGACLSLADILLDRPDLVKGKHVLELGAGLGFSGLVAASCAYFFL